MKVTKSSKMVQQENERERIANIGCDMCPECKETRTFTIDENNKAVGISMGIYTIEYRGLFNAKAYRRDHYNCYTCGAEWESEPYEV